MAEGNRRKGNYLFRNICRACHVENATGGQQANVGSDRSPIFRSTAHIDFEYWRIEEPCSKLQGIFEM
jgi:hypothetical protein